MCQEVNRSVTIWFWLTASITGSFLSSRDPSLLSRTVGLQEMEDVTSGSRLGSVAAPPMGDIVRPNVFDGGQRQGKDGGQVQPPGRPHPMKTDSVNERKLPKMKLDVQLNIGTICLHGNVLSCDTLHLG